MSDNKCVCGEINSRNCSVHQVKMQTGKMEEFQWTKKPREFWFRDTGQEQFTYDYFPEELNLSKNELVHVIEYSAYDKLKAERDAAISADQQSTELAVQMDDKYWAEFNRHEVTKQKLAAALNMCDDLMDYLWVYGDKNAHDTIQKIEDNFRKWKGEGNE